MRAFFILVIMSPLKILVTGVTSIHGWPVFELFRRMDNVQTLGIRSPKMKIPAGDDTLGLCITEKNAFQQIKNNFQPHVIIHAAGVCDLDVCEERPSWAFSMNTTGSQVIADIFGRDCYIIYLSSDLVFSGNNPPENGYTEECIPDPVSVAGKTIEMAERKIEDSRCWSIVRLGLPIGKSITGDKGAVDFVDSRLRKSLPLTLFHDEFRSCIGCDDICNVIKKMIDNRIEGLFHLGGPEPFSLYQIGEWVREKNNYLPGILKGISRFEEKNGPPRIGDVTLNSSKLENLLGYKISNPVLNYKLQI